MFSARRSCILILHTRGTHPPKHVLFMNFSEPLARACLTQHHEATSTECRRKYVVSSIQGHGSCRVIVPLFVSHSDSSTRTCRSEPCSCASCVCRGPSPPLARHFPHVSSNSTLDSQPTGRSLNPSLSQFRGLRDTPKGTSVAGHCPHFPVHTTIREPFVRACTGGAS